MKTKLTTYNPHNKFILQPYEILPFLKVILLTKFFPIETFTTENNTASAYASFWCCHSFGQNRLVLSTMKNFGNTSLFFGFGDQNPNYFRLPTRHLQSLNSKLVFILNWVIWPCNSRKRKNEKDLFKIPWMEQNRQRKLVYQMQRFVS